MSYEKDITERLGDSRNLVLLGCRADADIAHQKNKVKKLEAEVANLKREANPKCANCNGHGQVLRYCSTDEYVPCDSCSGRGY